MVELSIKVSNSEKSLVKKFLIYSESMVWSKNDEELNKMVVQAMEEFKGEVDDVALRAKMVW